MSVRTLCAYCGKLIKDGKLVNGKCSHGICKPCMRKELAKIKRYKGD